MASYPYVEVRVAYPGHPTLKLVNGVDAFGYLLCENTVADQFFHCREGIGTSCQEHVYRLPSEVEKVLEVAERVNGKRVRRWLAVHDGILHRLTFEAVIAVAKGSMTLADAVALCRDMPVGPDYEKSRQGSDD